MSGHVIAWAEIVEEEEYGQVDKGLFAYQVQSTSAEHIVNIVTELGIGTATGLKSESIIRQNNDVINENKVVQTSANNRFAVDEQLNDDFIQWQR